MQSSGGGGWRVTAEAEVVELLARATLTSETLSLSVSLMTMHEEHV